MKGGRRRRSQPRRKRPVGVPLTSVNVLMYTKNLVFTKFFDNNGVDEQGLSTTINFDQLFPASSSAYGNDYNRCCTVESIKITTRWASGFANPPVAFAAQWVFKEASGVVTWNAPSAWLSASRTTTIHCKAPPPVKAYIVEDPSQESVLKLRLKFFGMDLLPEAIPALSVQTVFKQEPVMFIAHSGK